MAYRSTADHGRRPGSRRGVRSRILVASTVADAEQTAALRYRAALGQLIDRATAGRATDDDAVRLRHLFGKIAPLPTGERGECRLVYIGKPHAADRRFFHQA